LALLIVVPADCLANGVRGTVSRAPRNVGRLKPPSSHFKGYAVSGPGMRSFRLAARRCRIARVTAYVSQVTVTQLQEV
jgi:hypothetical protein